MGKTTKNILIALLLTAVSACGGGGGFTGDGGGGTAAVRIGSGTGDSFIPGTLALGVSPLSAGGITSVTATLVDSSGNSYTTATDVSFSSLCVPGLASLTTPVTTINGVAVSNYTAQGCSGDDTITATAVVDGATLTATATINVLPATLGSIEFVSATPANIALKGAGGAGGAESSTVIFRVKDTNGSVVANQQVNFALNTTVGGLSLSPTTAISLADGTVQTTVTSGTVATTVRVTATIAGTSPAISTQSGQLVVSSGPPDQDSFSISAAILNPETFVINGVTNVISMFASDQFNNPVPNGTAINFITEGAQIQSSCQTSNGTCTVNWTSANPRPANGRVTILAAAIGEESFTDANGNGQLDAAAEPFIDANKSGFYDSGEAFTDRDANGSINPEHFADLGEAFRDDNENGVRDTSPTEPFLDFNSDSLLTSPDGKYNGIFCTPAAKLSGAICDAPNTLNVRNSIVLVMADSFASVGITPNPATFATCSTATAFIKPSMTVTATVTGVNNGQIMPAGTTVKFSSSNGKVLEPSSFTVPNSSADVTGGVNGLSVFSVTLESDASQTGTAAPFTCTNTSPAGTLTVTVTTPSGAITTASISVSD